MINHVMCFGLNTFTIIGLIAGPTLKFIKDTRSKIFENAIFEMKVIP